MRLKTLKIHGFKSFADTTEVHFHEGITAIVGPNGCGKSNISDAIRWVLGEQRPSVIRGGKMEEAIFQGSVKRRPINRGSVTMTVSNEDGALPVPFQEVEIGRTVYRDGGSDYSLNRSTCRLRDVVDLCRDTGLGANAYSIIESRMIDAILSDRAEERRSLFEEASGIGKYKDRRKGAMRRLERAELDLQRLEDVIAEVQTKVRSLARQKGKAQRYLELRGRRLSVEVTVVGRRLADLGTKLEAVKAGLSHDTGTGEGMAAELATAEVAHEELRLRQIDAEKARGEAAGTLEDLRSDLVRWERDLAVAMERQGYAERRLQQIGSERAESRTQAEAFAADQDSLAVQEAQRAGEAAEVRAEVERSRLQSEEVRGRLLEARRGVEALETRERSLARQVAQLEGDGAAALQQAEELARRMERLSLEAVSAAETIEDLASQGDLFSDRVAQLAGAVKAAAAVVASAEAAERGARAGVEKARNAEIEALDRASHLRARIEALDRMDADREGMEPVVQAALDLGVAKILGTVSDFIEADPVLVQAVEAFLGPLAQGVVVEDADAAQALQRWFSRDWTGGGGLFILPADAAPKTRAPKGDALKEVRMSGAGADWARALLDGVHLVEDEELLGGGTGTVRLSRSGASVDGRGILRLGSPSGTSGLLERKERLRALREEAETVLPLAERRTGEREEAQRAMAECTTGLEAAREGMRSAEDAAREAAAETRAQADQRSRMDGHRAEIANQIEGTIAAQARAQDRARTSEEERQRLLVEETELRDRRDVARQALDTVQEEWEEARSREAAYQIDLTRIESDLSRVRERIAHLDEARVAAEARIASLDAEEAQLRVDLQAVSELKARGEGETQRLFQDRDQATELLRERDQALTAVADAVRASEVLVRRVRAAEREATERRHRLELEHQEVVSRIERVRERIEAEWGKPLTELQAEAEVLDEPQDVLEAELSELVEQLGRIGLVNMLAVEEHEEESARLDFLTEQRDDLVQARDDLRAAIKQINQTATSLFNETFGQIRANFQTTFERLFQGGEANLWLADPDDPLESPIEIHASPRGKRTQRIDLLSGGERALTALSLLFGIYLVKPSPFCVLDEVDAPLDESNIGRFIRLLQEFKGQSQFVVITHNPRTIEAADWIYGVTMEEPGVSTIVGVRLEDALEVAGAA